MGEGRQRNKFKVMLIFKKITLLLFVGVFLFPLAFFSLKTQAYSSSDIYLIKVIENGLEFEIKGSEGKTIEQILKDSHIEVNKEDIVYPKLDTLYQPGTKIIIKRAMPVILNLYGKEERFLTQKETVQEFLTERGIEFKNNDLINVDFREKIFPGMEIRIWKKPEPKPEPKPKTETIKKGRVQEGEASWYRYISGDFCASTTFKKGTKLRVINLENGRSVVVTVNDYGPFSSKIIDLEKTAFSKLAPLSKGVIRVRVEELIP